MKLRKGLVALLMVYTLSTVSHAVENDIGEEFPDIDDDQDDVTIETVPEINIPYESPTIGDEFKSSIYLAEHFDDEMAFETRWQRSTTKKPGVDDDIAQYDGKWSLDAAEKYNLKGDKGLVLKTKAKHAAISTFLEKPFVFDTNLIVQYEVIFQNGQECGGAYLKLLTQELKDLKQFHDKTPYSIMFGPDKCGNDNKLHFIFQHKNPLNGTIEEKHCKKPKGRIDEVFTDKLPHLFRLHLTPDNRFNVYVDNVVTLSGNLLEDFTPAVNPPAEIDDPYDRRPDDWDEREKIPDEAATKPDDWDEDAPEKIVDETAKMPDDWLEDEASHVPDPEAVQPADWEPETDGEWEPPMIPNPMCEKVSGCGHWERPLISNPNYRGKWRAPLISNPTYKGKWLPRKIPNPDYYQDLEPFKRMQAISAVGFELWSMSDGIFFDNILVTSDGRVADEWAAATYEKKRQKVNQDSESVVQKLANITNAYPMLWIVYIIVLAIPVGFGLYICCKSSPKSTTTEEKVEMYKHKKTDEPQPDDEKIPQQKTKEDLEPKDDHNENEDDDDNDEEDDAEKISNQNSDDEDEDNEIDEEEEEQVEEEEDQEEGTAQKTSSQTEEVDDNATTKVFTGNENLTRKRKVRKE